GTETGAGGSSAVSALRRWRGTSREKCKAPWERGGCRKGPSRAGNGNCIAPDGKRMNHRVGYLRQVGILHILCWGQHSTARWAANWLAGSSSHPSSQEGHSAQRGKGSETGPVQDQCRPGFGQ